MGFLIAATVACVASSGAFAACTSAPSDALGLVLSGRSPTQLSWNPPSSSGGASLILYDVLRSSAPGDFSSATCVATGLSATSFSETGFAGSGYYLIRSRNACGGNLGTDSGGAPHTGATCKQALGGECTAHGDCLSSACCGGLCAAIVFATDPNNCGDCGIVCPSAPNAAPTCAGGVCYISCFAGFADCDGLSADGCECVGNLCCGGTCPPAHVNGLGQSFDDCSPLGVPGNAATYTQALAANARSAWPPIGTDGTSTCAGGINVVFRQTATSCAVWQYNKALAGYVHLNNSSNSCLCPSISDPTWK